MTLPFLGFVSLQGFIFATVIIGLGAIGAARGFQREFRSFFIFVAATALALYPHAHAYCTRLLADIGIPGAAYFAYLAVFLLALLVLLFLMFKVPPVDNISFMSWLNRLLGGIAGAVKGFIVCTLLFILLHAWRIPVKALYTSSELTEYIVGAWRYFGLIPELYLPGL